MVAFADGIESAQKQWREKASRVDDQITWWEPTERTFVPFDYPHTQTDEEMGAAAIEQARAMVRIERRRDEGWARAEGDDDFWLGGPVPDYWVTAEGEMRCDEESRQYPVFNRGRVIGIVTVARVIDPRFDGGDLAGTPLGPFDSGWCIAEAGLPVCTAMVDELSGFHRYVVAATGETRGIGAEYGGRGRRASGGPRRAGIRGHAGAHPRRSRVLRPCGAHSLRPVGRKHAPFTPPTDWSGPWRGRGRVDGGSRRAVLLISDRSFCSQSKSDSHRRRFRPLDSSATVPPAR